jgi:Putative Ig domain
MAFARRALCGSLAVSLICFFVGCGSGSAPSIAVSLLASAKAMDQAQIANISATVSNDSKNAGVSWSLSGDGALTNTTSTAATYTAPSSVTATFTATITATSISDSTKTSSVQITVNPLPAITTTSPLPSATAGALYSLALAISGGTSPFKWVVTAGSLPSGLSLSSSTGTITGTPTGEVNAQGFTVTVTDNAKNNAQAALTLTVNPPAPLSIATSSLPGGALTIAYSANLAATGGVAPYTWSYTGNLPPGLSLSSAGAITGTPTSVGTFNFTAHAVDSDTHAANTASAPLSITIAAAPLQITTASLPQGVINTVYSDPTLQATGGTPSYTWSISAGSLPTGLTLNANTGSITGTPTATGTFNFTAKVTDSTSQTATAPLSITINTTLSVTTTSLPNGNVGAAYAATLQASGGVQPYTWSLSSGSLPPGLTLNPATGSIAGTPTTAGTFAFTAQVVDSESPTVTKTKSLGITISPSSCSNNSSMSGNYAFAMEGWNTDSTYVQSATIASFVADGAGNISSGLLNTNDGTNGARNGTFTGTYCMGSNQLGTVTLNFGSPYNTSATLAVAMNSSGTSGRIMDYDSTNTKEVGPLRKQDTSAFSTGSISGNYAFGMAGTGAGGIKSRFAVAGQFVADGSGNLAGTADGDDSFSGKSSQVTLTSSDLAVASNGRGTASMAFAGGTMNFTMHFACYVVSTGEMLLMETDSMHTGNPLVVGDVLQQTGNFTEASLSGNAILGMQSLGIIGSTTVPDVVGGILNASGTGSASISLDENNGGTMGTQTGSGTYTVGSNGRVTLNGTSTHPPVFYLIGTNQGFALGTDNSVAFGELHPQVGSGFNEASFNGVYTGGSDYPQKLLVEEQVLTVNANGMGSLSGTFDNNVNGGGPTQSTPSETYAVTANGRVVVTQSGAQSLILYIVNPGAVLAVPAASADTNPALGWWFQ